MTDFRNLYNVLKVADPIFGSIYRAFGPVFREGTKIVYDTLRPYRHSGNFGDATALKPANHVNPLFVYSSIAFDRCALPRGMTQMTPFHVSSAFVYTTSGSSVDGLAPYSSALSPAERVTRMTTCIKTQFKDWCSAFRKAGSGVTIYHHTDDILRFCYALQSHLDPSTHNIFESCSAPWNPPRTLQTFPANISPYGPFDIIETCSLADEMALPTLLVCLLPLLKKTTEATLYTTNLVPADKTSPAQRLKSLLYCDPLTMFALLSCVPAEYVSGFCNGSSLHEIAMPVDVRVGVARPKGKDFKSEWKFSWKMWVENDSAISTAANRMPSATWETDTMVKILWDMYEAMYPQNENGFLERRCTLGHFFAFLSYLKTHVAADWKCILETFLDRCSNDGGSSKMAPGQAAEGDLVLQCHLHRLTSHSLLSLDSGGGAILPRLEPTLFPPNHSYPPDRHPLAGAYIMRVPRERLWPIVPYARRTDRDLRFRIQIFESSTIEFSFDCFEMTFATRNWQGVHACPVQEGWEGKGDLFVHVYLPLTLLMIMIVERLPFKVCLCVEPTTRTDTETFRMLYGEEFIVFGTDFMDTAHLWPCHPRSIVPSSSIPSFEMVELPKVGRVNKVPEISQPPSGPLQMTCRLEVYNEAEQRDLLNGCPVEFRSLSPWMAIVQTPKWSVNIPFPFPYNNANARLRISRKGGWFEIIAKFETSFKVDSIPISVSGDSPAQSIVIWNLPRILVEQLPTLDTSDSRRSDWIRTNVQSMFTAGQTTILHSENFEILREVSRIHSTLIKMFWSRLRPDLEFSIEALLGYFLSGTIMLGLEDGTPGAFIFMDSIKLHPAANSVVASAHIWPMTDYVFETHTDDIINLAERSCRVQCDREELSWWLSFLRASIERSRPWSHSSECYATKRPHLSFVDVTPICDCGRGKAVSAEFRANAEWAMFAPFVTRCALSPIFPVPYVDPIGTNLADYCMQSPDSAKVEPPTTAKIHISRQCLLCKSTPEQLKKCGKCGMAKYCSRECQAKDWVRHKTECRS